MFLRQQPSTDAIAGFLQRAAGEPLSYAPIGLATREAPGFVLDAHEALIGRGADAFERARAALASWAHFDLGWMQLHPRGAPVVPGTTIAVVINHLGFWSLNGARVVYLLEADAHEFGFAYGTLASHAEQGEEIFSVAMRPSGDVVYRLTAASRPRALLARLGYPMTRLFQARFRRDSTAAMTARLR